MAQTIFCGECGTKLKAPDAKACIKCGADPSRITKFCTNCGTAKASQNAVMCTSCGVSLGCGSGPSGKDPAMAALIAIVCMFFLGAPSIGYIYLGNVRKGIAYLIASWIIAGSVVAAYILGAFTYIGLICCLPLLLLPLLFELLVVYDVWLEASGEQTKLPNI